MFHPIGGMGVPLFYPTEGVGVPCLLPSMCSNSEFIEGTTQVLPVYRTAGPIIILVCIRCFIVYLPYVLNQDADCFWVIRGRQGQLSGHNNAYPLVYMIENTNYWEWTILFICAIFKSTILKITEHPTFQSYIFANWYLFDNTHLQNNA